MDAAAAAAAAAVGRPGGVDPALIIPMDDWMVELL
jgi:hypothetical protein